MREVKKVIKRSNKDSAFNAMQKHETTMVAKGWEVGSQFAGGSGLRYEYTTYFYK